MIRVLCLAVVAIALSFETFAFSCRDALTKPLRQLEFDFSGERVPDIVPLVETSSAQTPANDPIRKQLNFAIQSKDFLTARRLLVPAHLEEGWISYENILQLVEIFRDQASWLDPKMVKDALTTFGRVAERDPYEPHEGISYRRFEVGRQAVGKGVRVHRRMIFSYQTRRESNQIRFAGVIRAIRVAGEHFEPLLEGTPVAFDLFNKVSGNERSLTFKVVFAQPESGLVPEKEIKLLSGKPKEKAAMVEIIDLISSGAYHEPDFGIRIYGILKSNGLWD